MILLLDLEMSVLFSLRRLHTESVVKSLCFLYLDSWFNFYSAVENLLRKVKSCTFFSTRKEFFVCQVRLLIMYPVPVVKRNATKRIFSKLYLKAKLGSNAALLNFGELTSAIPLNKLTLMWSNIKKDRTFSPGSIKWFCQRQIINRTLLKNASLYKSFWF